ncbi:hypothetical protein QOT17_017476 [Balamuthia mandrillaris]
MEVVEQTKQGSKRQFAQLEDPPEENQQQQQTSTSAAAEELQSESHKKARNGPLRVPTKEGEPPREEIDFITARGQKMSVPTHLLQRMRALLWSDLDE